MILTDCHCHQCRMSAAASLIGVMIHMLGGKRSAAALVTVITETIGHINDGDDDEYPQLKT